MSQYKLYQGDCLEELSFFADNSVDSIVTDPPYGLAFMGKHWDYELPSEAIWRECLRVLKPGGYLLAFAGTRTQHRMAVRIEDAGFDIRDMIAWVYGSGFPKSLDVSKAIDKAAGVEREVGPVDPARASRLVNQRGKYMTDAGWSAGGRRITIDPPATEAARKWQGWGTALKPAMEPLTVARKPLVGTVAENVLAHGTGALNIDGCRVAGEVPVFDNNRKGVGSSFHSGSNRTGEVREGRWPANLIHDGSDEVLTAFPEAKGQQGDLKETGRRRPSSGRFGDMPPPRPHVARGDTGSASRFFYCAKASKSDRGGDNSHPTVKPTDLMRYLCRLVTPPGGVVLDPFMGSGSTGKAALLEGFRFIGIEREAEYMQIAKRRIQAVAEDDEL